MQLRSFAIRCVAACSLLSGAALAQSVTINPHYTSVGVNGKVQYSAKVTGLSNTAVTWSVSGMQGGNSTNGTITTAGLYTAPAAIPPNGVTISALGSDNKTSDTVYVNVAPPGPKISKITPNPLPVGSYTVTVNGSGFQSGAIVRAADVNLSTTYVDASTLKASGYQGTAGTVYFRAENPGSLWGPAFSVQFTSGGSSSSSSSSGGDSSSSGSSSGGSSSSSSSSGGSSSGSSSSGSSSSGGSGPPPTPVISSAGNNGQIPLGSFSTTVTGSGFTTQSVAKLNGSALSTTYGNAGSLTISGFASQSGAASLTVSNQSVTSQPYTLQVGPGNVQVSAAAARRFLQQAAFGPTPNDAAHVQQVGFQGWLNEQYAMQPVTSYADITSSQGGMPARFMTSAVTNSDQLRQRVTFALSQIFVTSLNKLIWNDNMTLYQDMLLADAFGNYRKLMGDVTLSPAMGQYLDMANNAKANPATGSLANENYARELMQLFTIGTAMLNPDGSVQTDSNHLPVPSYTQFNVTEFARVFTGWTYAPQSGQPVAWNAYISSYGPLAPYPAQHDNGSKSLLLGATSPAGATPQQDLNNALDNIFNHPNAGPFVGRLLIQHLVKSNPSPAYVARVAAAFANNGSGVRGDLQAVINAVLLDQEARANDAGTAEQATDGHLQEPALFIAGIVRAFGGQMTDQNYFPYELTNQGQDLFDPPSVFNYYSPGYRLPGGAPGPEFQIDTPNNAMLRANLAGSLMFSAYQKPVQTYGPGTTIDLTPFVNLAPTPANLVDALDLTLTRGVMPAAMKQTIVNAVTSDNSGNVHRVQTACYLILTSSYYGVWH